jgi:hypothetical protein
VNDDRQRLLDIVAATHDAATIVANGRAAFDDDPLTIRAAKNIVTEIGEAAKALSKCPPRRPSMGPGAVVVVESSTTPSSTTTGSSKTNSSSTTGTAALGKRVGTHSRPGAPAPLVSTGGTSGITIGAPFANAPSSPAAEDSTPASCLETGAPRTEQTSTCRLTLRRPLLTPEETLSIASHQHTAANTHERRRCSTKAEVDGAPPTRSPRIAGVRPRSADRVREFH